MKEAASLREEPSVKKEKVIESDPKRPVPPIEPDSEEGPVAPPLRPFRLELYDLDEDGEEEADRAAGGAGGGGGGRQTAGVGGGASLPCSPSDMSSDEGSPSPPPSQPPRWSATPQRNPRMSSPRRGLWERKWSLLSRTWRDRLLSAAAGATVTLAALWLGLIKAAAHQQKIWEFLGSSRSSHSSRKHC